MSFTPVNDPLTFHSTTIAEKKSNTRWRNLVHHERNCLESVVISQRKPQDWCSLLLYLELFFFKWAKLQWQINQWKSHLLSNKSESSKHPLTQKKKKNANTNAPSTTVDFHQIFKKRSARTPSHLTHMLTTKKFRPSTSTFFFFSHRSESNNNRGRV